MLITFLTYLLNLFGILIAGYLPGRLLLHFTTLHQKTQPYFTAFLALLLGFLGIAAAVAAFATGFKTVLCLYFLLPALLLFTFRRHAGPASSMLKDFFNLKLLVLLAGGLVLFAAAFVNLSGSDLFGFVFPWRDNIFYALVSNHIFSTGTESFYLNASLIDPDAVKPIPYHYFELWLNAAVSETFGGLYFHNLMLVTAVALRVLILAGMLALWENYFPKVSWPGLLVCFCFLFLKGIAFDIYAKIFSNLIVPDQLSVNAQGLKFLTGYVFFLGFANCFVRRQWFAGALLLAAYPVAHVLALPGVLAGTAALVLIWFFRYRHLGIKAGPAFKTVAAITAVIGLLGLFYTIFGAHQSGTRSQNILLMVKTFQPDSLMALLRAFLQNLLRFVLVTWPFLLAGFIGYVTWFRQANRQPAPAPETQLFLFGGFALLGGALVSAILHPGIEAHQPLQILVPVLNVCLCLLLILLLKKAAATASPAKRYSWFAAVLALLFLGYNPVTQLFRRGAVSAANMPYQNYSAAYLSQVAQLFQSRTLNPLGSCILGPQDLNYFYGYSPLHYTLGLYLPYIANNTFVFSLSEFFTPFPENPTQKQEAMDNTAAGAFYKFVQKQKTAGQFRSINQSQVDFIRHYRLGYVIISPNAPENPLLENLSEIKLSDPATGERFLLMKPL